MQTYSYSKREQVNIKLKQFTYLLEEIFWPEAYLEQKVTINKIYLLCERCFFEGS